MLVLQFRRYSGSRVFVFDTGRSIRATVLGLGGEHYDLGGGAIAFQPLAGIDDPATRSWAADWLEGLLAHEGIEPDPGIKDALWSALGSLASARSEEHTSELQSLMRISYAVFCLKTKNTHTKHKSAG